MENTTRPIPESRRHDEYVVSIRFLSQVSDGIRRCSIPAKILHRASPQSRSFRLKSTVKGYHDFTSAFHGLHAECRMHSVDVHDCALPYRNST
jgi:hypothetical protein